MSLVRITKEFGFEMSHVLYGYDGPCSQVHGHSYKLFVTVRGKIKDDNEHPKNGMVMDFGVLKRIVKKEIVDVFDHALVVNGNSPHAKIKNSGPGFEKVITVPYQPTCERMVEDFAEIIQKNLPEGIELFSIRMHETATSFAEWFASDNA